MSDSSDTAAKRFEPQPKPARIYVYRNETFGSGIPMGVVLNGRPIGYTGPLTYFVFDVEPGTHRITSLAENTSELTVETRAGGLYYVWQEVKGGKKWRAASCG